MKGIIIFSAILLAVSIGLWIGVAVTYETTNVTYSGRLLLTADEYHQLKKFLVDNQEVAIIQLEAWNSPETLLNFKFLAPHDTFVPYGIPSGKFGNNTFVASAIVLSGMFLCWLIAFFIANASGNK